MLGYRQFRLSIIDEKLALCSVNQGQVHRPGQAAECLYRGMLGHKEDMEHCACGYYAYLAPREAEDGFPTYKHHNYRMSNIPALVSGYGKVILHEEGFRAEYMRVLALLVPHCQCGKALELEVSERSMLPMGTASSSWLDTMTGPNYTTIRVACPELIAPVDRCETDSIEALAQRYEAKVIDKWPDLPMVDPMKVEGRELRKPRLAEETQWIPVQIQNTYHPPDVPPALTMQVIRDVVRKAFGG